MVNMIIPTQIQSPFKDYAFGSFLPFVKAQILTATRIDFIWDDYRENSLKATTRTKRSNGVSQRVQEEK